MKSVIITGSSGFIGKKLEDFLKREYQIIRMDKDEGRDITKIESFENLSADYVIHLAALMRKEDPITMFDVNVNGLLNVLEFCKKNKTKLIFASSMLVYGNAESPLKEDSLLNPESLYGLSKFIGEKLCEFYSKKFNIPITILRFSNIYGLNQPLGALIPDIISQLKNQTIILRNPHPKRDFIYIDDVISAINKSLDCRDFEIINISNNKSYSVLDVAKKIVEMNNSKNNLIFSEDVLIETDIYMDNSKAKRLLNWNPQFSLEDGIKNILSI